MFETNSKRLFHSKPVVTLKVNQTTKRIMKLNTQGKDKFPYYFNLTLIIQTWSRLMKF